MKIEVTVTFVLSAHSRNGRQVDIFNSSSRELELSLEESLDVELTQLRENSEVILDYTIGERKQI